MPRYEFSCKFEMPKDFDREIEIPSNVPEISDVRLTKESKALSDLTWLLRMNIQGENPEELQKKCVDFSEVLLDEWSFKLGFGLELTKPRIQRIPDGPNQLYVDVVLPMPVVTIVIQNNCGPLHKYELEILQNSATGQKDCLLHLYRQAMISQEKVTGFLLFYLIFQIGCGDVTQDELDKKIYEVAGKLGINAPRLPTRPKKSNKNPAKSEETKLEETKFSRLRNELAHREIDFKQTKREIENCEAEFGRIAREFILEKT